MTREQLFTTSFGNQFALYMGWTGSGLQSARPIAPSDLPGFEIVLGETTITSFDSLGYPITGIQQFGLHLFWPHAQLSLDLRELSRSNYIQQIEAFFAGTYTPPAPSPSDPDRIDAIQLQKIDPPLLHKTDTRSVIAVRGAYNFTIL
jgi:hypothetical protein